MSAERHGMPSAQDRASFETFLRVYLELKLIPVAYRYAAVRQLPSASAMDILSTALVRVWEKQWHTLATENDERRLATIFRFMQLVSLEQQRKEGRAIVTAPDELPDCAGRDPYEYVDSRLAAESAVALVAEALSELPDEQRTIIELAGIAGLSVSEIATQTGLTATNVSSRLSRARARLKHMVGGHVLAEFGIGRLSKEPEGGTR
ncbi:RNA polymerase sigma factor [Nocardia sp. NPDC058518]|uniref:RNA polymerase sigma factor n=1 Tax=Nocardia sp. NPDC058518 TaxID=3346534 RepID=UPI00365DD5E7